MKIFVDQARCQGHGRCYATAPDLFEPIDDHGHSDVLCAEISAGDDELADMAWQALHACPERAITIEE